MTQIAILQSMQVGIPRSYGNEGDADDMRRPWESSFFRKPSLEIRRLFFTHLEGNAQADTKNHGRPEQAVLLYAAGHYPLWRRELALPEIGSGGFGENFTLAGLEEEMACIGDTYGIGEARIQVTGPRWPCRKIERRWGLEGLTARVAATGRTGWYCRVLREGMIEPGAPVMLIAQPFPEWTVGLANDIGHGRNRDAATARALAECPLLNMWWQDLIRHRVAQLEGRAEAVQAT